MKKNFILELYKAKNTVFTTRDISLLLGETNSDILKSKINYYVKRGGLKQLRRGIYAKDEYDIFELATRIYTPSYISLETVLQKEGVTFQYYQTIFVVSYLSREIVVDSHKIKIRKIKNSILLNPQGILTGGNYSIATNERAFLDSLYLYKSYHFDNLDILDKEKIFELVEIYKHKSLRDTVGKLFNNA